MEGELICLYSRNAYTVNILFLLNQPNDVSDISIIDMNARTVMKDVNRQKSINISNLSRGVYILKINSTSKVDTFKFIK